MQTRKLISVGLLLLVIIISLVFSIMIKPFSKEGLELVDNPSASDLKKITEYLNDSTSSNFTKIKNIYNIVNNYVFLKTIYINLANDCLKSITEYITISPIKDRNGDILDENTISKDRIEKISGILVNKMESPDKIFAIRPFICDDAGKCDKKLSNIYNNYEKIWIDMLNGYVNQLNSEKGKQNKKTAAEFGKIV